MFYRFMSAVLLGAVLWGFARTWFLRVWVSPDRVAELANPLTIWIVLHGITATTWFILYVTQSWIARTRRDLHKTLGLSALVLAPIVAVSGVVMGGAVTGPAFGAFAVLAAAGLWFRRRRDDHMRLMYLASVVLSIPGWGRLMQIDLGFPFRQDAILYMLPLLILVQLGWDVLTTRRPHRATVLGGGLALLALW